MLQRHLKAIANESIFNPNKPTVAQKITMDVGNPDYWVIKAMEHLIHSEILNRTEWHKELKSAIGLLILARTVEKEHGETKKQKTRKKKRTSSGKTKNDIASDGTV